MNNNFQVHYKKWKALWTQSNATHRKGYKKTIKGIKKQLSQS